MEEGTQILPPPVLEPISRPSSTSTSASANLTQLPGISSLASSNGAINSPQTRPVNPPPPTYNGASPAATTVGTGGNPPTCQNCSTSITPLWRRDEFGSVLCNACGLFLKLHGRPRPISLKTDVIKSRNRVKAMRPDIVPKKKQQQQQQGFPVTTDVSGAEIPNSTAAQAAQAARRVSQKAANGHDDGESPVSRTGTPSMYSQPLPSFMVDDPYNSSAVAGYNSSGTVDGRPASPVSADRNSDSPQTHEQLIAHNSSLKTRVSELEVINELFRGRLSQLEQQEAAARRGQEVAGVEQTQLRSELDASQESESQLRAQLEDSHRRENNLKRRLDELELELKEALDAASPARPAKKPRVDGGAVHADESETAGAAPADGMLAKEEADPTEAADTTKAVGAAAS